MNLREGKIGRQETICALVISLCISGLFSIDSADAYEKGNSTYISIPLAACIALLVFLLAAWAMRSSRSANLISMLEYGAGKVLGRVIALALSFMLLLFAAIPMTRFFDILHNLFYTTSNYFALSIYVLPAIMVFAWLGFEIIGRSSKLFIVIVLAVHLMLIIFAITECEPLNLAPVMGDGYAHLSEFAVTGNILFLPGLLAVLCLTRGTQGLKNARFSGISAVLIVVLICGVTQLVLGMIYPYSELAGIYTPLTKLNTSSINENVLARLDTLATFTWFMGAIIAAAFYIYSASYIYTQSFEQKDIRPVVCALSTLALAVTIASHLGEFILSNVLKPLREYGGFVVTIPVAAASLSAVIRSKAEAKKHGGAESERVC